MSSRTVIDGNAFYEIDEECLEQKRIAEEKKRRNIKRDGAEEWKEKKQKGRTED